MQKCTNNRSSKYYKMELTDKIFRPAVQHVSTFYVVHSYLVFLKMCMLSENAMQLINAKSGFKKCFPTYLPYFLRI